MSKVIALLSFILLSGCDYGVNEFKEAKTFAGAKTVDASILNLGKATYLEYCVQCHGYEGKGDGPSSKGLLPPPRNLTQGLYKFVNVPYGEVPHDVDMYRVIKGGLKGSAMLEWDISPKRLDAVVQYIKTFAPEAWASDKELGVKYDLPENPYGENKRAEAIERGKRAYHVVAQCTTCHRAYETRAEISKFNKEINGENLTDFDATLYQLKAQDSEFNYKSLPPDFTYHELRTISDLESIVQRLMYGVSGSGMPGWKDVVSDEDLWAMAYYVDELIKLKSNNEGRKALLNSLENQ